MGAGDGSISGCDATGGKNGIFQYTARGNCTATNLAAGATYIADDGTTKNFTGNLPDVFSLHRRASASPDAASSRSWRR